MNESVINEFDVNGNVDVDVDLDLNDKESVIEKEKLEVSSVKYTN